MSSSRNVLGGCSKDVHGGSKASVAKCVARPWNSTRSVGGRAKSTSWTFRNQVYVVRLSQVRRCLAGQRRVNETCQLEVDTSLDRKPVQLTKNWRDVVRSSSSVIVTLILSCTFSEILQVFCAHNPSLFHLNFWSVPIGPDLRSPMLAKFLTYSAVKLFLKFSNLCEKNIPERHRHTDRQTGRQSDDLLCHHRALSSLAR